MRSFTEDVDVVPKSRYRWDAINTGGKCVSVTSRSQAGNDMLAFTQAELSVARRAFARQMLAITGVNNPAVAAAFAVVPRGFSWAAAMDGGVTIDGLPYPLQL